MRRQRGLTVIELLTTVIVTGVLMSGLLYAVVSIYQAESFANAMPSVQSDARQMALTVAAGLRNTTTCSTIDEGAGPCTWVGGPIQDPSNTPGTSQVTVYRRSPNANGIPGAGTGLSNVRYYIDNNGNFAIDTITGHSPTVVTTRTLYPGASLTLTFYSNQSSGRYHVSALTPFLPTNLTSNQIVGVDITANVSRTINNTVGNDNKVTGTYTTSIRIRNSPQQTGQLTD